MESNRPFKAELVGCFGQPVAENPTGAMQEAAFQSVGLNWRYLTVEVPRESLRDAILGMRAFGMRDVNVTIPNKVSVIELLALRNCSTSCMVLSDCSRSKLKAGTRLCTQLSVKCTRSPESRILPLLGGLKYKA